MKKVIFILLAFTLCLGSAMANDVGKLQPSSTTTLAVGMQHDFVSPAFDLVTMEIAPVVSVQVAKVPESQVFYCKPIKTDAWRNPDYGPSLIDLACNIQNTGLNSKLRPHGLITDSRTWNYNIDNSYGLRY